MLLAERDAAYRDSRLRARWLSFRMNLPTADESQMLLTGPELERVLARPVPEREGAPVVGVDLGGGRAWSAAVAQWENGRVECVAVAPGIPSIESRKRTRPRAPWQLSEIGQRWFPAGGARPTQATARSVGQCHVGYVGQAKAGHLSTVSVWTN